MECRIVLTPIQRGLAHHGRGAAQRGEKAAKEFQEGKEGGKERGKEGKEVMCGQPKSCQQGKR